MKKLVAGLCVGAVTLVGCGTISGMFGVAGTTSASPVGAAPGSGGTTSAPVGQPVASSGGGEAAPPAAARPLTDDGPGPESADDYHAAMSECRVPCYVPQREPAHVQARVKGYITCHVYESRAPGAAWGLTGVGCARQDPVPVHPYRVPRVPGHYRALMRQATRLGVERQSLGEGTTLVPAPRAHWQDAGRDDSTGYPQRTLELREYSREFGMLNARCGVADRSAVCEPSGSHVVTGFNVSRFALQQAQHFQQQHQRNACRASAWVAWAFAHDVGSLHEHLVSTGSWASGRHYVTRYDGTMSEAAILHAVDDTEHAALRLYQQCGGRGEPPLTAADQDGNLVQHQVQQRFRYACVDVPEGTVSPPTSDVHCGAHGAQPPGAS